MVLKENKFSKDRFKQNVVRKKHFLSDLSEWCWVLHYYQQIDSLIANQGITFDKEIHL